MKLYEDCFKDVDRALALGYPKSQQLYNLHLRKAKCLKFLGKDYAECVAEAFKVTFLLKCQILFIVKIFFQAIKENNVSDMERLNDLVLSKMKEPEPVYKGVPIVNKWKIPELSYGQNREVPSFSSAASLVHNEHFGRHLLANRKIDTGNFLN
jgi:hypothetical protein